ncbi:MAG: hypothetical protein AB1391_00785 [Candidatus Micrarchaeota archaeon]
MEIRNFIMPFAALIVTLLAGYVIYSVGVGSLEKNPHGTIEGVSKELQKEDLSIGANIVLAAIEKPYKYQNYTYEYVDQPDDYSIQTRIVHSPDFSIVKIKTPVFEKSGYFGSNTSVLCVTYFENTSCSEIGQNSTLMPELEGMKNKLISNKISDPTKAMKIYLESGAAKFNEKIEKGNINGTECNIVRYTLDYSKLTLDDLKEIGLNQDDPVLFVSKTYSFEYCVDNDSNVLSVSMDYSYFGTPKRAVTKIIENGWNKANRSEFVFRISENETATHELFFNAKNNEQQILACLKDKTTKDECVKTYAIQQRIPEICLFANQSKDNCIAMISPMMQRGDLCLKIGNESIRDICLIETAWYAKNETLCTLVANISQQAYCVSEVRKRAQ